LSRIDFGLFQKIKTTEFNKLAFSKPNKEIDSPNVTAISVRFNQISYWVATQIIIGGNDRIKTVEKFIKLCKVIYLAFFDFLFIDLFNKNRNFMSWAISLPSLLLQPGWKSIRFLV